MPELKLVDQVQGNIAPGFSKDHQAFVLISFPTATSARLWLGRIGDELATAAQVSAFKEALKAVTAGAGAGSPPRLTARWTNVALTWRGIQTLVGPAVAAGLPQTFKGNRVPFAAVGAEDDDVHALLILAADDPDHLADDLTRHRAGLADSGVREVRTYRGRARAGGIDQFGFKDLVSQPRVMGIDPADPTRGPSVAASEFIVGAPAADGRVVESGPPWTSLGSYLAFLELEQHVEQFRESMQREAARLGLTADALAARIVGRNQDGSSVSDPPSRTSHVARAHPTWLGAAEANRHLLLRRGIAYGDPLDQSASSNGRRGLLFLAYQADLRRQFEQVWGGWLNSPNLPLPNIGSDGLVGQSPHGDAQRAVAVQSGTTSGFRVRLPRFVTPHYGAYFFAPSREGLRYLASVPNGPVRQRTPGRTS